MKIFINYRRDDSADIAGRIYDYLTPPIGPFRLRDVFKDVNSIPLGVNFKTYIESVVQQCDACIAIIGPNWINATDQEGHRRLNDPRDFVRIEVETALEARMLVIPLMVMGASMPKSGELPASLTELPFMNGMSIRPDPDFKNDMTRLIQELQANSKEKFGIIHRLLRPSSDTSVMQKVTHFSSQEILPQPFAWIDIPTGKVTLVNEYETTYLGKSGEKKTFDVPAFSIAKYPVTNAQFAKFVESGGYEQRRWWPHVGWQLREQNNWAEPHLWHDLTWSHPNQPVIGVSWFEAIAFCQWLSEITGEKVILPTEQQWQRAAQGNTNWAYPWGEQFDANRCNFKSKSSTPVTQYEGKGDSPFQVVDMSGNVREWCLTDYESGLSVLDPEARSFLVQRGGSGDQTGEFALRNDFRNRTYPDDRNTFIGFRIVRS